MSDAVSWELGTLDEANELLAFEHYLGPIRTARIVTLGRIGLDVVAAQVWKLPTARRLPNDGTYLELARWCLTPAAGPNAGSRMHSHAVRAIRAQSDAQVLVSYSDPGYGHSGALYRACNWEWFPVWHRLRQPPSGNGQWTPGKVEGVKDRWAFRLNRRADLTPLLLDDHGAMRYWLTHGPDEQRRWARTHPQLGPLCRPGA